MLVPFDGSIPFILSATYDYPIPAKPKMEPVNGQSTIHNCLQQASDSSTTDRAERNNPKDCLSSIKIGREQPILKRRKILATNKGTGRPGGQRLA